MEWDGTKSSYHSQATKRCRKLRRPAEAAAAARAADAARKARLLKWAEDFNIVDCLRVIKLVTALIGIISKCTTLISDDISSCHSQLLGIIEMLEPSIHPVVIPLGRTGYREQSYCG